MPAPVHKATVIVGDTTAIFEGPKAWVEAQAAKYTPSSANNQVDTEPKPASGAATAATERQLVEEKSPKGHPETVAVLAYALAQNGRGEFTDEDMRRAYIRAGVRPPKVVAQAIRDAKNLADYVETTSKRGIYRLSHHGDRTVRFDLPRTKKH